MNRARQEPEPGRAGSRRLLDAVAALGMLVVVLVMAREAVHALQLFAASDEAAPASPAPPILSDTDYDESAPVRLVWNGVSSERRIARLPGIDLQAAARTVRASPWWRESLFDPDVATRTYDRVTERSLTRVAVSVDRTRAKTATFTPTARETIVVLIRTLSDLERTASTQSIGELGEVVRLSSGGQLALSLEHGDPSVTDLYVLLLDDVATSRRGVHGALTARGMGAERVHGLDLFSNRHHECSLQWIEDDAGGGICTVQVRRRAGPNVSTER